MGRGQRKFYFRKFIFLTGKQENSALFTCWSVQEGKGLGAQFPLRVPFWLRAWMLLLLNLTSIRLKHSCCVMNVYKRTIVISRHKHVTQLHITRIKLFKDDSNLLNYLQLTRNNGGIIQTKTNWIFLPKMKRLYFLRQPETCRFRRNNREKCDTIKEIYRKTMNLGF